MFGKKSPHSRIPSIFRRKPWYEKLPVPLKDSAGKAAGPFRFLLNVMRNARVLAPGWLKFAVVLALGAVLGAGIMKWRHASTDVVVVVGKTAIPAPYFYHRLEMAAGPQVLATILDEELSTQYALKHHLLPSLAAVNARMKTAQARPDFQENLRRSHQTLADVRRSIGLQLIRESMMTGSIDVSDSDVKAYYAAQTDPRNPNARYLVPSTVYLKVVVSPDKGRIGKAWTELQRGAAFAEVARKYSQDDTAQAGGVMPPLVRGQSKGASVPGFEDTVFGMTPGQTLPPKQFAGLWWILSCQENIPANVTPFQSVAQQCREAARISRGVAANLSHVTADLRTFRQQTRVQLFWDQYLKDLQ